MSTIDVSPRPSFLIESMRDIGYTLETAMADIVDNCIAAYASKIDIRFSWNDSKPWIAFIDDGKGMGQNDLISAMKFVSQNPLDSRSKTDLGRFGLGLKTASISQCRALTVLSKKDSRLFCVQWDLDYLASLNTNEWSLRVIDTNAQDENIKLIDLYNQYMINNKSGTIVFWHKIDRLGNKENESFHEEYFNEALSKVKQHLELVFHRFISPNDGTKKIEITFNELILEAFDPFNTSKSSELRSEEFLFENERILVQPYILPHHNKVSRDEWKKYAGDRGYLHEQGFYVYRNKRLIIHSTWFRLIEKAELTKLLRVRVDIPNSFDHLWRIDIKKSNAYPPSGIRIGLKRIISKIQIKGQDVYRQKGQRISTITKHPSWVRIASDNQIFYKINDQHPLIRNYFNSLESSDDKESFNSIIKMLETTFPRDSFFSDLANSPESMGSPKLSKDEILKFLNFFINPDDIKPEATKLNSILNSEPFSSNENIVKQIFNERKYEY
jgi:hypothetical protein